MSAELPRPGKCKSCGRSVHDSAACCPSCRSKARIRAKRKRDDRRAQGFCLRGCGRKSASGRSFCAACQNRRCVASRKAYNERAQRGQCVVCASLATVGLHCFEHWLKNVGNSHGLGNKKGIALLKELWVEQGGRCAVTGEVLVAGSTASLDHVIPKSRGGTNSKDNLRWVLLRVNQIKWDMTHEEFIAICHLVVRVHDQREVAEVAIYELNARSN